MRGSQRARGLAAVGVAVSLAIGLVAGAACGARPRSTDTLVDSIRGYNEGVRWGRFAAAASRIPPRERSQFVADMDERAEELKITDYEIVNVEARGSREARVQVKVSWYRASEGTLRETHAVQTWERLGDAWMMVAEARVRGAQMPGLSEPADSLAPMNPAEPTAVNR
ncbi:MAG TPA: hypothetical protein VNO30_24515 [Kofleriaceae bacterium]|nr:hypothetical protein [Kofleriaceae bacterium]